VKLNKTISFITLAATSISVIGCHSSNINNLNPELELTSSVPLVNIAAVASRNGQVIPGEFIVKFKPSATNSANALAAAGAEKVRSIGHTAMQLVRVENADKNSMANLQKSLKNSIEWIEPNRIMTLDYRDAKPYQPSSRADEEFPNDPMFGDQYAHKVSNSVEGWKISQGSSDLVLAIVDTGVDGTHPELKDKMVAGFDVMNPDTPDSANKDPMGHGTHCAGIAAATANNKIGVAGFAPNVKIQSVRVLDNNGSGTYEGVAQGMVWAAEHGAKVMSMSLGGPSSSKVLEDAVAVAVKNDVLIIAAMGNSGNEKPSYPAAIKGVMPIGATDSKDKRATFSQYGAHISVTAPGVNILSTFPMYASGMPAKEYGSISGTSMATPAAAGVAALVRSKFTAFKAEETRAKIEKGTDDLGDKGWDKYYGFGRINVANALK
jgi:thermitase